MTLSSYKVGAAIGVSDMDRANEFYEGRLGLTVRTDDADGGRTYGCGGDTTVHVFPSPGNTGTSTATLAGWAVDDVERVVAELTSKGVTFERYDEPPLTTDEKGIAVMGDSMAAWFKDPDGNLLALTQVQGPAG